MRMTRRAVCLGVGVAWALLAAVASAASTSLDLAWPHWPFAFGAAALWGLNLIVLVYVIGPPFTVSRVPLLAVAFGFLMTVVGTGSYWATTIVFPSYRVNIERAMLFVALCTTVTLCGLAGALGALARLPPKTQPRLEWAWARLRIATYLVSAVAAVGTVESLLRIGYIPVLSGDPTNVRFDFPAIGGIWYRLSMMGGVAAVLVAAQAAARRATPWVYLAGVSCLVMVGVYGNRFPVALPVGVALLLWDRLRARLPVRRVVLALAVLSPVVPFAGYWRQGFPVGSALGPGGLFLFKTFGEFRDLGWALEFYGRPDRLVHGATLGSIVVPLLPAPVWSLVGIDKQAIYVRDSATLVADAMGQTTGQRIGAYGEFYMNYGWVGALVGAAAYGVLLGYLDHRFRQAAPGQVRSVLLALVAAAAIFAQIGQLNMFTSAVSGLGYPILLVVLAAARRPSL